MTKLLKTIRFDDSDNNVFVTTADQGEWALSCAFQYCDQDEGAIDGKQRQAFNNGLLGLSSYGYSTFGVVSSITPAELNQIEALFAEYLTLEFNAPHMVAAMGAAREEISYISELCADVDLGKVFAVSRVFEADGKISEKFHMVNVDNHEEIAQDS